MNGVGGDTIAEARKTVSYSEAMTWMAYISKWGSLNIGRRIEQSGAVVAKASYFGKTKDDVDIYDLMPHEEKPVATEEQIRKMLGG